MKQPEQKKTATMQDIATAAGASRATVSRVLSNSSYPVSDELRATILRIAKETNYSPNLLGRMLKANSNCAIGVIVATLQNPFFNQVLLGIESEAHRRNYELLICNSHRDPVLERQHIMSMLQKRVMGLIIFSVDDSPQAMQNYIDSGGSLALLEANFSLERAIKANTDFRIAGEMAAEHLIAMGHQRIAFLTSPLTKHSRRRTLEGLQATFQRNGIDFSEQDIILAKSEKELDDGMYEFEQGKELAREFLSQRGSYTAIVVINDITAFGVLQCLSQNGVRVPEDVSVISFDNIVYSAMTTPALTTVELPSSPMGTTACKLLLDSMETPGISSLENLTFSFPSQLKMRQSVKRIEAKP